MVGEVLADRGLSIAVVAVGGGSLLLLGMLDRPTEDLDLVAIARDGVLLSAEPMPPELALAVSDVAALLGLPSTWMNAGPADLLRLGLPGGFDERVITKRFGGLTVHLAGRFDQICFKLYAAVDQGPRSKHFADLRALAPSHDELRAAARWAQTHDPSEPFRDQLEQALVALGVQRDGAR